MKCVKPEIIVGATQPHCGASNSVLMTFFADLHFAQDMLNTVFLYLHDESTPEQVLDRLDKIVDDAEGMSMRYSQFGQQLIVPVLTDMTPEQIGELVKQIVGGLPVTVQVWVYADLQRTFKLGCTTGAGMVVPFTVETNDVLADALNGGAVRFRAASMTTRLGD